jgi:predicted RNA-binding Zn-ribbon protein involved in translation (DUF1610 family)
MPEPPRDAPDRLLEQHLQPEIPYGKQPCPRCGTLISEVAGSKAAICPNCGFKDPCC